MMMFSSVIPRCLQDCRHMWCHTCCKLKDWVGGVLWDNGLLLSKQFVSVCCVFIRLWNWVQREWWCTSCNFFAFGIFHLFYMIGSYEDKLGQLNQLVEAVIVAILVALSSHWLANPKNFSYVSHCFQLLLNWLSVKLCPLFSYLRWIHINIQCYGLVIRSVWLCVIILVSQIPSSP